MSGTQSSIVKNKNSKIYNERMLSRAASVNSNGSMGPRVGIRQGLQNSEAKSMVRVALKNQRRQEKITAVEGNSIAPSTSSMDYRQQRNRVNSGVPFLRAGTGTGAGAQHEYKRTSSNLSRQGGNSINGRLSAINQSSSKKNVANQDAFVFEEELQAHACQRQLSQLSEFE